MEQTPATTKTAWDGPNDPLSVATSPRKRREPRASRGPRTPVLKRASAREQLLLGSRRIRTQLLVENWSLAAQRGLT